MRMMIILLSLVIGSIPLYASSTLEEAVRQTEVLPLINSKTQAPQSECTATVKKIVKIADGMRALCKNQDDFLRYQSGGTYRVIPSGVTKVSKGKFNINFKMQYLKCVKENGQYKMVSETSPFSYAYETVLPNFKKSQITIEKKNVKLRAYRDGIYKPSEGKISKQDDNYTTSLDIDLKQVLTNSDVKNLQQNKKIVVPVDFFQVGQSRSVVPEQAATEFEPFHGGAFRIFFEISKEQEDFILKLK